MPKTTRREWYAQKRRHLQVGKRYRLRNKLLLGLLSVSHILTWILGGTVVALAPELIVWTASAFGLRLLLVWLMLGLANRNLGHTLHWLVMPFFDFVYFVYYLIMGIITLFSKRTIKWR
jgi:hypothetical protein